MEIFRKKQELPSAATAPQARASGRFSTKARGNLAENAALAYLEAQGLRLVRRNFSTPGRGGGEVDLIMREPDGTLVFVEVRQRSGVRQGGAGGSVTATKQKRIVLAARHFLHQIGSEPACRFDVVLIQGATLEWLRATFDASASF